MKDTTFGFIGLGLIGGSIAKGIKRACPDARIMAYMRTRAKLEQAQADNDALSGQVNALAQEGSDLAEQLKKSEEARQELLIRPAPQPEEPAERGLF